MSERKDGVTLIREDNGRELECEGVTVATSTANGGNSTLLSLIAHDFRTKFKQPSTTSFGQLIARRLAKPIVRVVMAGVVEFWELPEETFTREPTKTGRGLYLKHKAPGGKPAWRRVGETRWQELVQA